MEYFDLIFYQGMVADRAGVALQTVHMSADGAGNVSVRGGWELYYSVGSVKVKYSVARFVYVKSLRG